MNPSQLRPRELAGAPGRAVGGLPGAPASPSATPPEPRPAPPARHRPSGRPALVLALGLAVALVGGLIVAVTLSTVGPPATIVGPAASDVAGWAGLTFRGPLGDSGNGPTELVMTVDRAGNARGTLTRAGARAEFALIGAAELVKADRAWWQRAGAPAADRLDGIWVRNPVTQVSGVRAVLTTPSSLAAHLGQDARWIRRGRQAVGGARACAFVAGGIGRVVLADRPAPRLLFFEPARPGNEPPMRIERADPAAVASVADMVPTVAFTPTYAEKLVDPPTVLPPGALVVHTMAV